MPRASLPPDDPQRQLTVANIDDPAAHHLSIAGGSYTILITGEQTAGRYCLIDLLVPPGGGPPPHRHDFEEMFTLLEGEVELTFRGHTTTARTGTTVNIPANAPHSFRNTSHSPAHLLCLCTPPGPGGHLPHGNALTQDFGELSRAASRLRLPAVPARWAEARYRTRQNETLFAVSLFPPASHIPFPRRDLYPKM
jgi:quercetin dioxygenase-like cupin family protein